MVWPHWHQQPRSALCGLHVVSWSACLDLQALGRYAGACPVCMQLEAPGLVRVCDWYLGSQLTPLYRGEGRTLSSFSCSINTHIRRTLSSSASPPPYRFTIRESYRLHTPVAVPICVHHFSFSLCLHSRHQRHFHRLRCHCC